MMARSPLWFLLTAATRYAAEIALLKIWGKAKK
jgi:hypothetical protein